VLPSPRENLLHNWDATCRLCEAIIVTRDEKLDLIGDGQEVGRALTRREMVQRMLAGMGAGMAWPLVAASHPIHRLLSDGAIFSGADAQMASADWKPLFLNAPQNEALVALSEIIVPGSAKAQVNRFIDLLLSVDTPANQKNFSASISAMDDESQKRFGHPFAALRGDQQNEILITASKEDVSDSDGKDKGSEARHSEGKHARETRPSLNDHFNNLKGWISGAYYSSETGMTELGWTGEYGFENYPSCQHAEEHH
jgi:Gluconate 2-dehydrogenase subunit 3